ncbi:MAG: hypothetical protein MI807_09590, partial [Verrucomicrobiales bacterium]|nr:hypothetical protein [Verrucomicrobiales bacterium]
MATVSMGSRTKLLPILLISLLLCAILVIRLLTSGMTWWGIAALVLAVLWFGFELVRFLIPRPIRDFPPATDDGDLGNRVETPGDLVSLVYFLSEPRIPDESVIRNCVANVLGITFDASDPDAEHFVMRFEPPKEPKKEEGPIQHFMIRIPQGLFAVLVSDRPYIDNPKAFASQTIRDKRLRNAVEGHQAWMSVDLMDGPESPEKKAEAYYTIAQILSSLAGPDVLAIYCPELQRCNEFDLSLIDALSSPNPLALFEEPTFEPIIEISDNNPRMAAAVAEAIKRWPEFVEAFQERADPTDESYIIKAEFREGGNCEYMWVSVEEITEDV